MATIALAFLVRLIHLTHAPANPLTYHPGADEDYYIQFALDVAQGQFGLTPDFIFMDPLYGYLLGFLFYLFGQNLLIVYLLQTMVDTLTVFLIYLIGRELWSHRAGLIAACLYALSSTALLYSTKILKPTLVANFIILWSLLAIRMWQTERLIAWFWYGVFLGLGVAIRSNLLLLAIAGMVIIPWGNYNSNKLNFRQYGQRLILLLLGLSLPLILLSVRNNTVTNSWSILPPNGGVVLHQIYNQDNPHAEHKISGFVRYSNPIEIWHGYQKEAESRLGRQLETKEINSYWRSQAIDYITNNRIQTLDNMVRKLGMFTSFREISYNKSLAKDELFSPILALLPRPFGWLFALGLPGLMLLGWKTPKSWPMLVAVGATIATFIVFVAAARFRFHALPLFAVGAGVFIAAVSEWKQDSIHKNIIALTLAICLAGISIWHGLRAQETPIDWTTIAWGYLKMGQPEDASRYATMELQRNPNNPSAHELSGYLAFADKRYKQAIVHYRQSLKLAFNRHVIHYNLGLSLEHTGQVNLALDAVTTAVNLNPLPEYLYKQGQLYEAYGNPDQALLSYRRLLDLPVQRGNWTTLSIKATKRVRKLEYPDKNVESNMY